MYMFHMNRDKRVIRKEYFRICTHAMLARSLPLVARCAKEGRLKLLPILPTFLTLRTRFRSVPTNCRIVHRREVLKEICVT